MAGGRGPRQPGPAPSQSQLTLIMALDGRRSWQRRWRRHARARARPKEAAPAAAAAGGRGQRPASGRPRQVSRVRAGRPNCVSVCANACKSSGRHGRCGGGAVCGAMAAKGGGGRRGAGGGRRALAQVAWGCPAGALSRTVFRPAHAAQERRNLPPRRAWWALLATTPPPGCAPRWNGSHARTRRCRWRTRMCTGWPRRSSACEQRHGRWRSSRGADDRGPCMEWWAEGCMAMVAARASERSRHGVG